MFFIARCLYDFCQCPPPPEFQIRDSEDANSIYQPTPGDKPTTFKGWDVVHASMFWGSKSFPNTDVKNLETNF
jgi:hypothetical protein